MEFAGKLIVLIIIIVLTNSKIVYSEDSNVNCEGLISDELKQEIKSYEETANKIIDLVVSGAFKGRTYKTLAHFADKFGSRLAGTTNLEKSIDYMMEKMREDGMVNVKGEEVKIPQWIRGEEKATLISPRSKQLKIIGLGMSVGTPLLGITAKAIVVKTFDELKARASEVAGKIVVFYQDYGKDYLAAALYRKKGAVEAAKLGAVACLVRSITPFSIGSPHTGTVIYEAGIKEIPAAALSIEDAALLHRMYIRGHNVTIKLVLNNKFGKPTVSRNAMGDTIGRTKPDNFVLIGCHIDSWDVGEGVMDDAGGCILALEAQNVLKHLKLTPSRTLQTILFTAEEISYYGVNQYIERHRSTLNKINVFMESDTGTFRPNGVNFAGVGSAACIVKEVLTLLSPVNATGMKRLSKIGGDTDSFTNAKVPTISLDADQGKYIWFHHTDGDTMTVEDPDEMDLCLAVWAVASYVISDLSVDLPRT